MTNGTRRLVVVGGGVIGTMHAIEGVRRGYDVTQLERDLAPRGASVRNFGLIWVSGRAPGVELELALRARQRWEEIAAVSHAIGFRPCGSLTVATSEIEREALEAAAELADAPMRGFRLMSGDEARAMNPALGGRVVAALFCSHDAAVEPRLVLGALREHLSSTGAYRYLPGREVVSYATEQVSDASGETHHGDLVVICPGAEATPLTSGALRDAPLRRVRLQMLETAPLASDLTTSVANADSLRYYPAFSELGGALAEQHPLGVTWGIQLLLVQRRSGQLTIGDTHRYDEPFDFDIDDAPTEHLLDLANEVLGGAVPAVERRWAGVYIETTNPSLIYFRTEVAPGVVIVTGPGGRGMTLSPAIAEETFS